MDVTEKYLIVLLFLLVTVFYYIVYTAAQREFRRKMKKAREISNEEVKHAQDIARHVRGGHPISEIYYDLDELEEYHRKLQHLDSGL